MICSKPLFVLLRWGGMQLYSVIVTRDAEMKEKLSPAHFNQPMVKKCTCRAYFLCRFSSFQQVV